MCIRTLHYITSNTFVYYFRITVKGAKIQDPLDLFLALVKASGKTKSNKSQVCKCHKPLDIHGSHFKFSNVTFKYFGPLRIALGCQNLNFDVGYLAIFIAYSFRKQWVTNTKIL